MRNFKFLFISSCFVIGGGLIGALYSSYQLKQIANQAIAERDSLRLESWKTKDHAWLLYHTIGQGRTPDQIHEAVDSLINHFEQIEGEAK